MTDTCVMETPIGNLCITTDEKGLCAIGRVQEPVKAPGTPLLRECARQLREYFDGTRFVFDLPLHESGTDFQLKCWAALRDIPYGETRSYGQQATAIGNPKATRAVGGANHNNRIIIVVPCHRVIGADGLLTGFGGGLDIKEWLLAHEQRHKPNT